MRLQRKRAWQRRLERLWLDFSFCREERDREWTKHWAGRRKRKKSRRHKINDDVSWRVRLLPETLMPPCHTYVSTDAHTYWHAHTHMYIYTHTQSESTTTTTKNLGKEYESVDIKRTILCYAKFCQVTSSNHHRWHLCVWSWICCYCVCCCFPEPSDRNRALSLPTLLSPRSCEARTKPKNWKNSITAAKCPLFLTRKQLARVCSWNNQANLTTWLEFTDDLLLAFVSLFLFVYLFMNWKVKVVLSSFYRASKGWHCIANGAVSVAIIMNNHVKKYSCFNPRVISLQFFILFHFKVDF